MRPTLNREILMATNREKRLAIRRVLKLVDGYLSTQDQDLLLAWRDGLMTWGEIRQHVQAAIRLTADVKHRMHK